MTLEQLNRNAQAWAESYSSNHCPQQLRSLALAFVAGYGLAESGPDDGDEPVTTEWLVESGGRITEWDLRAYGDKDNPNHRYPKVKFGPLVWYTNLWTGDGHGNFTATYFLKYQGACLGCGPELTRNQFRHLCAGLGIEMKEKK